ncbi:hypothetical protein [Actinacidiphila bryophytorum]|jgi:hypothetical protein|uniref:hypothetical protein n=1 Tax=Actinacidiphila bryophytorum TaxID=1436133 RepID=UPI002176AE7F|nr:hypothetical protein [Actinacidiphila bryophytorum]UWE08368.1 hypothetical protein NYE86_06260 [Actinacidiphila bryophytorum]
MTSPDRKPAVQRLFHLLYGEPWWHLATLLASFALCGYAMAQLLTGDWRGVLEWAVGAAVIHDLVAVPLYGSADWLLHRAVRGSRPRSPRRIAVVNHIRVPAFVSLMLLLVYWPLISRDSAAQLRYATLLDAGVFRTRWMAVTGVLFGLSGLHLAYRLWRDRGKAPV